MEYKRQIEEILGEYEVKSQNEWILTLLITAPETQLSKQINDKCRDILARVKLGNITPEELRDFLVDDVYETCCEISGFVKAMANPQFITREDYMRGLKE